MTTDDAEPGAASANPSPWGQGGGPLRLTVYKYPPPNGSSGNGADSAGIDDWTVPWSPARDALYPDDWIVPAKASAGASDPDDWIIPTPSATPNNAPPTPSALPGAGIGAGRIGTAAPFVNSNSVPSPPIARNPMFPSAAQMGATAWDPPIFPKDWPAIIARYFPASAAPLKPPTLLGSFGQYPSAGNVSSLGSSIGPTDGSVLPASASAKNIPFASSPVRRAESTFTNVNQQPRQLFQENSPNPDRSTDLTASVAASGNLRSGPTVDRPFGPDAPGTATRVVRGPDGRTIAIIHAYPAPPTAQSPRTQNDASPDTIRPGARYAQTNLAISNIPVVDRTTDMLLRVLQQSVRAMGSGSGALFGVKVHTDFAKRVRRLDLPGIGQKGVEQSFHVDYDDFVDYGLEGSIRTDVTLRDPKDPNQRPIAVYDLKTGKAVLKPPRVREILAAVKGEKVLIIELQYITGDAVDRRIDVP